MKNAVSNVNKEHALVENRKQQRKVKESSRSFHASQMRSDW